MRDKRNQVLTTGGDALKPLASRNLSEHLNCLSISSIMIRPALEEAGDIFVAVGESRTIHYFSVIVEALTLHRIQQIHLHS